MLKKSSKPPIPLGIKCDCSLLPHQVSSINPFPFSSLLHPSHTGPCCSWVPQSFLPSQDPGFCCSFCLGHSSFKFAVQSQFKSPLGGAFFDPEVHIGPLTPAAPPSSVNLSTSLLLPLHSFHFLYHECRVSLAFVLFYEVPTGLGALAGREWTSLCGLPQYLMLSTEHMLNKCLENSCVASTSLLCFMCGWTIHPPCNPW